MRTRTKAGSAPQVPRLPSPYSRNDSAKLAGLAASYLAGKPDHRLYLNENNHQTKNTLFPILYNRFRGLLSLERAARGRHSAFAPKYTNTLAPAARSVLPFAAPRILDNCIKIDIGRSARAASRRPRGVTRNQLLVLATTLLYFANQRGPGRYTSGQKGLEFETNLIP